MKVEMPVEQWNALNEAAKRNIELLTLACANIALAAQEQAKVEEATPAASVESRATRTPRRKGR